MPLVLPPPLILLEDRSGSAIPVASDTIDQCPASGGAYALALRLPAALTVAYGRKSATFSPGWYVYAGSAYGPAGLRARLARHLRRDKKPHWHIDRLTGVAERMAALAMPGGKECAIVDTALASGQFTQPAPGFGSSDCRHCQSHLLMWEGGGP